MTIQLKKSVPRSLDALLLAPKDRDEKSQITTRIDQLARLITYEECPVCLKTELSAVLHPPMPEGSRVHSVCLSCILNPQTIALFSRKCLCCKQDISLLNHGVLDWLDPQQEKRVQAYPEKIENRRDVLVDESTREEVIVWFNETAEDRVRRMGEYEASVERERAQREPDIQEWVLVNRPTILQSREQILAIIEDGELPLLEDFLPSHDFPSHYRNHLIARVFEDDRDIVSSMQRLGAI